MIIFILRRILLLIVTIFLLSILGFSLCFIPAHAPLHDVNVINAFGFWYKGLLQLDFGLSSVNSQPILTQIQEFFPATIELCLMAFSLALFLGIPLGIVAALNKQKWADKIISNLALLGFSVPIFWLALLLTLLFSLTLGWLPVSGRLDLLYSIPYLTGFSFIDLFLMHSEHKVLILKSLVLHLILPVATLCVAPLTEVVKLTRNSTLDVIEKGYIKAAVTRGLSRFTVVRRHVLHNAIPPIIPHLGLQFAIMLSLTMITEAVFNWPGLGLWLLTAIRQQDYASVSTGVMVMGSLVVLVNTVSDILGAVLNPLKHKEWYAGR